MDGETVWMVVGGAPCTGKTTLARRLAGELRAPLISKDGVKVPLFDALGAKDREWSRRLDGAAYAVLFATLEEELRAGRSAIVEANFKPAQHRARIMEMAARWRCRTVELFCRTETETLLRRFDARAASGQRHPGHCDEALRRELRAMVEDGRYAPLDLGGPLLEVDTTRFDEDAWRRTLQWAKAAWARP
ncbi:MAG TPA: ATP-binding protein [Candidatus Brocadiia bacterium]|nr:ATP-binding protein [Candidatus Brocadiia bacterium]